MIFKICRFRHWCWYSCLRASSLKSAWPKIPLSVRDIIDVMEQCIHTKAVLHILSSCAVFSDHDTKPTCSYTTHNLLKITQCFVMEQLTILKWQPCIQRLIGSMTRRCQAVIASRGSHTSYWQLLLLVIELIGTFAWLGVTFWNPHFGRSGGNLHFGGSASLMTERMLPIVHIWYMAMKFRN